MITANDFEIFLATAPGLESVLCAEVKSKGFKRAIAVPGGVTIRGGWPEVWRANLWLRGAGRVLARIASFKATDLAALEAAARRVPWAKVLRPDIAVDIGVACSKSRIYHTGAAAERLENAIRDTLGVTIANAAPITIMARIDNDICTISVDTSGELLHKRGYKESVNAAPMRETMAALFLRQCGYDGKEPVLDPMCGAGTFVIEAAEIAAGLNPGRARGFAFELLATYDETAWAQMRSVSRNLVPTARCYGRDRDANAITMSCDNAKRAGVAELTTFTQCPISDLQPPAGPPGLVIVNPPFGERMSDKSRLSTLYRALGSTLITRFMGWRVGLVTSDKQLAYATALPFMPTSAPVAHGGLRVTLFQTAALMAK